MVVKTFKGREYKYECQVEYSYRQAPFPYLGTVLSFPNETDPEKPQFNGSMSWHGPLNWIDWKPIIPEWKEGEVYRHGHSVTMNGHIYVASLRYEYLIPPENRGTEANPDYYYMRDERQEEQGPLLDVDKEGIRTWVLAPRSLKEHPTYQYEGKLQAIGFMENEWYRIPYHGVLPENQRPWYGFDAMLFGADTMVSHPYTNPMMDTEEITNASLYGYVYSVYECLSSEYFQHILLRVKDKFAPNGQYIARDTASPQQVSEDAHATWSEAPTDRRKLVSFWYSSVVDQHGVNQVVFEKPSIYYRPDGSPDTYRNGEAGVPSLWDGDWYYEDKGVLPANKCAVGYQSKHFSQGVWPSTEFAFLDGDEDTGAGTWYYQKDYDPGKPDAFSFIDGEVPGYYAAPIAHQYGLDNGLGNAVQNIGRAYGFVFNDKQTPKKPDGSDYYDYDENGNPTSWTDEDGNVNQGTEIENGDGTTTWVYTNDNGDDVGLPTDNNGNEVESFTDRWTHITEGEGHGKFPPRLIGVCYTSKANPQNIYAPTWKKCVKHPTDENGDELYQYDSDGIVTGWTDVDGNDYTVVENGDGTFTGFNDTGDEVDLPGGDPYGAPDDYKIYTQELPASPPDNKPWLRDLYFYFWYNHGVYGDRTVEVEIEVETSLHSWNIRELQPFDGTIPVISQKNPGQYPPIYDYKFIPWHPGAGEVELGFCDEGGWRAGHWKKVQWYYWDNRTQQRLPVPYDPTYPNYGYTWDYPPGTNCYPYENPLKKTKFTVKKSFKITTDSYASFQFFDNIVGVKLKNTNKISDGAPNPGEGFCKFYVDIHSQYANDDTDYTWRLSKVKFSDDL